MTSATGKQEAQGAANPRLVAELTLALLAGVLLIAGRLGLQTVAASFDRRVIAIAFLGVITAAAAIVAARRSDDGWCFWALIALAAVAWEPGRALPDGAHRGALLVFNAGFVISVAAFAIALGLAVHASTDSAARQKLALDLIPQMIGLIVIAWLGWIGPRALNNTDGGWFGAIAAGHGLVDVLLAGLCAAGAVGRRQGVAGKPSLFVLAGVSLLATGDALALPMWERWDSILTAGSQAIIALGFLLIAYAAARAWRPRQESPREAAVAASWTEQLPNLVLIGLLLVAIAQALFGRRVQGGVATAIAAGIVIIIFGMARQSLTTRAERRLRQEIDQLSTRIDGLVSQVGRDPLTGLLNHRAIHERLEQEIERARAAGSSLAVALVDVDNFKMINDRRGHQAGDRVLRAISSILIAACRGTDVAARYAGDEFMVIFPDLDEAHAAAVCERIIKEVRRINHFLNLGQNLNVTLSVGVAVGHRLNEGALRIIGIADAAMYDAKESGKDQAVIVNADTMVAIVSARKDVVIPTGGLPLLQPPPKDRRRFARFEQAS
jgi:diguanylate cyclase (GGDEF)-like protein